MRYPLSPPKLVSAFGPGWVGTIPVCMWPKSVSVMRERR